MLPKMLVPEDGARKKEAERWTAEEAGQNPEAPSPGSNLNLTGDPSTEDLLQCVLVEPTGNYRTAAGEIPRFDIQTSNMLSDGIRDLNGQKIVPTITSGYRSPEYQKELIKSGKGTTPAKVSNHQIGAAVDFGPNSNPGNGAAIQKAMTDAGLVWGGNFRRPDSLHYQSRPAGSVPDPAYVRACLRAITGK